MDSSFETALDRYAELAIRVGLNLQQGQRLVITHIRHGGVPLEVAPLVRRLVAHAYDAGSPLVEVIWRDDALTRMRFEKAPRDSFTEYPDWRARGLLDHVQAGGALLSILAANPDLLQDQDPSLVASAQKVAWEKNKDLSDLFITRNAVNWLVISASYPGWAAKVFPGLPREEGQAKLWEALFRVCRLDRPDPVAAWGEHIRQLVARCDWLNQRAFGALRFRGPGTDLTVGLPAGHRWMSARFVAQNGIDFTANLPTEEIFTLPHRDQTEGTVRATRPLEYGSSLIEDFQVRFSAGQAVEVSSRTGEGVLRQLIETDEGAPRLGEVALVPHSSPISRSGMSFYNTLLDENCASHVAFGEAYRFSLEGGEGMSGEEFRSAGGNTSLIHVDFMIGSGQIDVDGLTSTGATEALMRQGEWAFEV
jgi:aminopeptidase